VTPDQLRILNSAKGHLTHAKHNSSNLTAKARAAFRQKFVDQVDPDGELAPEERERRANHALKAHMRLLALTSAQARKAKCPKPVRR
jgi:hypothetical protein